MSNQNSASSKCYTWNKKLIENIASSIHKPPDINIATYREISLIKVLIQLQRSDTTCKGALLRLLQDSRYGIEFTYIFSGMVKTLIDIDLSCILPKLALVEETKIKEYKKHRLADMEHKCLIMLRKKNFLFYVKIFHKSIPLAMFWSRFVQTLKPKKI